mmetsp:Transcript_81931/g.129533  ORF Transcript_81931/g.129533 Transcript_81931/m.129533 type:complete len:231 (+) Transcript_81931:370-1062(+)
MPQALSLCRLTARPAPHKFQAVVKPHLAMVSIHLHGVAIELCPKLRGAPRNLPNVGVLREPHLHDGMFGFPLQLAPQGDHAVRNAQSFHGRGTNDAMPCTVGIATIPDVGSIGDRLIQATFPSFPFYRDLALFVADLPGHLPLQHEELLDEFQALELRLQRRGEESITDVAPNVSPPRGILAPFGCDARLFQSGRGHGGGGGAASHREGRTWLLSLWEAPSSLAAPCHSL